MKGSKRKIVNGQMFQKQQNLDLKIPRKHNMNVLPLENLAMMYLESLTFSWNNALD